jgi:hypothetical protein
LAEGEEPGKPSQCHGNVMTIVPEPQAEPKPQAAGDAVMVKMVSRGRHRDERGQKYLYELRSRAAALPLTQSS